jgi:hypothetical protein
MMMRLLSLFSILLLSQPSNAFILVKQQQLAPQHDILGFATKNENEDSMTPGTDSGEVPIITGVVAPLSYKGPYACLSLDFPELSSSPSTSTTTKPTTLDFVLDTGANLNTINAAIVDTYQLNVEYKFPANTPLVGTTTSSMNAGSLYRLGDCKLHGLPPDQSQFLFLKDLTAISLPYATPVGEGILGIPFMQSFPAGIEFDWYGTDGDPPTIIFHYGPEPLPHVTKDMVRIPLDTIAGAGSIMMVNVTINYGSMKKIIPALVDTGAPITILDPDVASEIGIEVTSSMLDLKIRGVEGDAMEVLPSQELIPMTIENPWSSSSSKVIYDLGQHRIFIGRLPGLEAIQHIIGGDQNVSMRTPLMTLGLDWLIQSSYRMLFRAPKNELWFEPLKDQPRWTGGNEK